jgi:hypothetical protein
LAVASSYDCHAKISREIELAREQMVRLGDRLGFLHPDVQLCSKQLDELLIEYYKMNGWNRSVNK